MAPVFTERRVFSIIILVLTAGLVVSTFGLDFADLGGAFSPMFFPRIILIVLLGLAALNMAVDLHTPEEQYPIEIWPVVIISIAFVAYVLVVMSLGYFISSFAVGLVILLALGLRNPLQIILFPLCGAGALVGLFNHVLKMPLPSSPFFWWI
ncbi:tripartite tricarboxylate transporter TctB family protein [Phaeobacter sp. J2-8]|uniref:tripartite tricarboxylate transporter TctB family protein n=1 Tax=Phaeobacter sp. J2-8 TaxID=2931394 RepID=UPI001FD1ACAD|nr:tripartite tricarboxylate transporter TctB family protein [Phaeobacter sp. J2-8]MCJ7873442.1 tripartite tricarboxylate transporter TctB family protein [Phaeobacter sp. J2-8]